MVNDRGFEEAVGLEKAHEVLVLGGNDHLSTLSKLRHDFCHRLLAVSLVLWVGVVLGGRWIAYTDYLYFLYE